MDKAARLLGRTREACKKLLEKVDKADDLEPENINDLAKIVRATAALFNSMEKWQTGEEMLEIWRGEIEEDAE